MDVVKNDIEVLGDDLELTLRLAYGEVWRFNTIAEEYDNTWEQPLPSGHTVEAALIDRALSAIICLFTAEHRLSTYLPDQDQYTASDE